MADEPINYRATLPASPDLKSIYHADEAVIALVEEQLTVGKRAVAGGTVKVTTRTETREEIAEVTLDRAEVDVQRVSVNLAIDAVPAVRHEGDTMIVAVIEERLVVTKQLYLVEELHIRQKLTQEIVRQTVQLRQQHAVVERTDAEGKPLATGTLAGNQ